MKNIYKYLFIFVFFISSFLLINSVKADYTATVLNPEGSKCEYNSKSTGFCFYQNNNLNSVGGSVHWLDTGDEVTVLTDYATMPTKDVNLCSDYYVYTSYYYPAKGKSFYGYYCNAYLTTGEISDELKNEFRISGFPESYWSKLAILKTAHPNWNFRAITTSLKFSDVVLNQTYGAKSLIRGSASNNYAYLDYGESAFDYYNNHYIPYDDTTGSDPWYLANYNTIAYYIDPRNFLSDMYIFQFETLSYDNNVSDETLKMSIITIFENDYLANFSDTFVEAGKISGVNPIYLASLAKEEVSNGMDPGTAISGTYNGMYNFYNIGASGGENPVYRGLDFASNTDDSTLRPWNSEYNAIVGGAKWIYNMYVYAGQDTSYFKKYNVVYNYLLDNEKTPIYENYTHQYMQNIMAPSNEAATTYRSYYENNMLGLSYTFYIPVYLDMPDVTTQPSTGGWPNNYLSSLTINDTNVADFDGAVETYNYNLDVNNPEITIEATPVSDTATVTGTGKFKITENTTKTITVIAENGNVKTYKIKITLTGTKLDDPIDVVTTLNNAGIKNGDKYISGLAEKTDISVIKEKIQNVNKDAIVSLKNRSDQEKNTGIIATGDKVIITVGSEVKTYEIVLYGDATGDGKVSAPDYKKIKDSIMGTANLSGAYNEAADVDRNGRILASDYKRIKDYIMGTGTISQ